MQPRKHVDFISAIIYFAVSLYVLWEGYAYYVLIQRGGRTPTPFYESPGFFPVIIGTGLLISSLMLLIRSLKGGLLKENILNLKDGAVTFAKSSTARKALIGCTWMGLYVFYLLETLGFIYGTILFLVGLMLFLQWNEILSSERNKKISMLLKIASVSVISVLATYLVFQQIFRAPLPIGTLFM